MAKKPAAHDVILACDECGEEFRVQKMVHGGVVTTTHEASCWFAEGRREWRAECACGEWSGFSLLNLIGVLEPRTRKHRISGGNHGRT